MFSNDPPTFSLKRGCCWICECQLQSWKDGQAGAAPMPELMRSPDGAVAASNLICSFLGTASKERGPNSDWTDVMRAGGHAVAGAILLEGWARPPTRPRVGPSLRWGLPNGHCIWASRGCGMSYHSSLLPLACPDTVFRKLIPCSSFVSPAAQAP